MPAGAIVGEWEPVGDRAPLSFLLSLQGQKLAGAVGQEGDESPGPAGSAGGGGHDEDQPGRLGERLQDREALVGVPAGAVEHDCERGRSPAASPLRAQDTAARTDDLLAKAQGKWERVVKGPRQLPLRPRELPSRPLVKNGQC